MDSNAGHVFISHGFDDREAAIELTRFFERRGVKVWIAPRDVRPGMDYSVQLQQAIEDCAAFAVLVSEHANKSAYVRVETEMAFSSNRPIFPIRLGDHKPAAGLALFLKIKHWTDAFGPERETNMERLAEELRSVAAPPDPSQARTLAWSPPPQPRQVEPLATDHALDEDQALRAFVGPNASQYLARWRRMSRRESATSWHWPAFLFGAFWLGYRKMYGLMSAVAVALLVLSFFSLSGSPAATGLASSAGLGIAIWLGLYANNLYRTHADKIIAEENETLADAVMMRDRLELRGGTSVPALIGVGILFGVGSLTAAAVTGGAMSEAAATNEIVMAENIMLPDNAMTNMSSAVSGLGETAGNTVSNTIATDYMPPPPPPLPAGLDRDWLLGTWAESWAECQKGSGIDFRDDGRAVGSGGFQGELNWRIDGYRIIMDGSGGTLIWRVTPVDYTNANVTLQDGETLPITRCTS